MVMSESNHSECDHSKGSHSAFTDYGHASCGKRAALAIGHEVKRAGAAAAGAAAEGAVRGAQARHAHAAAYAERDRRLAGALRSASGGALGQALARWRGAMSKTSWLGRRPAGAPEAPFSARSGLRLP